MKKYFKDISNNNHIIYFYYDTINKHWYIHRNTGWSFHTDEEYYSFKRESRTYKALIPMTDEAELLLELL